jgi:uncharacterized surface protein with fasciclin (FAS1) repeats
VDGKKCALLLNVDSLLVNTSTFTSTDITTSNSIIHVIDSVIVCDVAPPQNFGTIADVASDNGNFTTRLMALNTTELNALVADPTNTFTVFSPTNAAFSKFQRRI